MGVQTMNFSTKILLLACALALATAAPAPRDRVVPETSLIQQQEVKLSDNDDAYLAAKATVDELLQQSEDSDACEKLAKADIKEVETAVDTQQKILDGLPDGSTCPSEGQEAVDAAQKNADDAVKNKEDADKAVTALQSKPITFSPKPLDTLKEGQCDVFFEDPAYKKAVDDLASAESDADKAKGAVDAMNTALEAAKDAQEKAIAACQCQVRMFYDKAWATANENNDANKKAYEKGKHMQCILDGIDPTKCDLGTTPTVQPVTLDEGVPATSFTLKGKGKRCANFNGGRIFDFSAKTAAACLEKCVTDPALKNKTEKVKTDCQRFSFTTDSSKKVQCHYMEAGYECKPETDSWAKPPANLYESCFA